eukprot:161823-Chlamydomonas_euryale.AAC.1
MEGKATGKKGVICKSACAAIRQSTNSCTKLPVPSPVSSPFPCPLSLPLSPLPRRVPLPQSSSPISPTAICPPREPNMPATHLVGHTPALQRFQRVSHTSRPTPNATPRDPNVPAAHLVGHIPAAQRRQRAARHLCHVGVAGGHQLHKIVDAAEVPHRVLSRV